MDFAAAPCNKLFGRVTLVYSVLFEVCLRHYCVIMLLVVLSDHSCNVHVTKELCCCTTRLKHSSYDRKHVLSYNRKHVLSYNRKHVLLIYDLYLQNCCLNRTASLVLPAICADCVVKARGFVLQRNICAIQFPLPTAYSLPFYDDVFE